MIEQLTVLLAAPIVKAILDKFYEGVGSKLGEKAVELLPEKVRQLGQLVWDKCLRGKPDTEALLQKAANGSATEQQKLADYLAKVLESDGAFRQEVQKLAEEIHLEVTQNNIQAKNVMYVTGEAQGLQVNDPNQSHHPDTARSLLNIAVLYYDLNRIVEARPLIHRAVKIVEQSLGDRHPHTIRAHQWQQAIEQAAARG